MFSSVSATQVSPPQTCDQTISLFSQSFEQWAHEVNVFLLTSVNSNCSAGFKRKTRKECSLLQDLTVHVLQFCLLDLPVLTTGLNWQTAGCQSGSCGGQDKQSANHSWSVSEALIRACFFRTFPVGLGLSRHKLWLWRPSFQIEPLLLWDYQTLWLRVMKLHWIGV